MSVSEVETRILTADNFYQVMKWANAQDCWPLTQPVPAIHLDVGLARLGDEITRHPDGRISLHHTEQHQPA